MAPRTEQTVDAALPRASAARDRLLRTASAIFYADGINGVGVDRIITEAHVTRATFYRHFASKEELVVAYLVAADAAVRARITDAASGAPSAAAEVLAIAAAMGDDLCRAGFRGCAFINAAAEFPDPGSPVHRAVVGHRAWMEGALVDAFARAGHDDPARAGRQLVMLRDGAVVAGYLGDAAGARATFLRAVEELVLSSGLALTADRAPTAERAPRTE